MQTDDANAQSESAGALTDPGIGNSVLEADIRIGPDPARPGRSRWKFIDYDIPVWAIIGHIRGLTEYEAAPWRLDDAIRDATEGYRIPEAAIRAAWRFYEADPASIDARLALDAESSDATG